MKSTNNGLTKIRRDILMRKPISRRELTALLIRLEAAEYALLRFHAIPKDGWTQGERDAVIEWRTSKGEGVITK